MSQLTALRLLREEIQKIVFNNERAIDLVLAALLARGHVLIEDVPGVGKTLLAQALGRMLGLSFARIQFTNDLLPADVLGGMIFLEKDGRFEFQKGPIFHQLVLADELNRTSPRTQSAFLQAMEESVVNIEGQVFSLPEPFHVIATQNPMTQIGVFPLPESQVDRFMIGLSLNAADDETELRLIQGDDPRRRMFEMNPTLSSNEFLLWQKEVESVEMNRNLSEFVLRLLKFGRDRGDLLSSRAGIALGRMARAWAWIQGRKIVVTEDVQSVFGPVLALRLSRGQGLKAGQRRAEEILESVAPQF